ncbi:MAG TPA: ABC transporter permease, partial [Gemmatimonadaceae bacterium]|nr:ABC transporter permease [Gemmatimonadaceae bacterium]
MIRDGIRKVFRVAVNRPDRWERDVDEEITLHLALRAEQLIAEGVAREHAGAEAARRFGSIGEARARLVDAARHREQRLQRTEYFADLRHDAVFALRTLSRQKGWTTVTILTLALGIGATTAVFSVVSTLLLHAVPYPHGDRVVDVFQQPASGNRTGIEVTITPSAPTVRAWMAGSRSFEAIEGVSSGPRALKTADDPVSVMTATVFPTFFGFAGTHAILGRTFTPADLDAGGRVTLLGESMWRGRFGGDPAAIGKTITLGDSLYTIIGVAPSTLRLPGAPIDPVDAWIPLDVRNDSLGMSVIGRLRPGATIAGAMRELDSLFARSAGFASAAIPFKTAVVRPAQRVRFHDSLVMLAWAVALVLLVACANVAHLLVARSVTRQRELAIRDALGAGRGRVLRQLLTESLILSLGGTVLGVGLGWLGLRGLIALRPASLDSLQTARLDLDTLGLTIAIAILTGATFAMMGAVQAARHSANDALKSGSLTTSRSRRDGRVRSLLVVSELALSGTLLVGAALLLKSVINLQRTDLGFTPHGLYALSLPLDANHIAASARAGVLGGVVSGIRDLPGVQAVAVASVAPGSRWFRIGHLQVRGEAAPTTEKSGFIDVISAQPSYFRTMGIPLRAGAVFSDTSGDSREVIVNAGFARAHWPGTSAVGHQIRVAGTGSEPWLTIVGVAGDASTDGPAAWSSAPVLYTPPPPDLHNPVILIRTTGGAASVAPLLALARRYGVRRSADLESVEDVISRSIAAPRFIMLLLSIFTVLAVVLAGVGLYGVMSYTVERRRNEIGIRMA